MDFPPCWKDVFAPLLGNRSAIAGAVKRYRYILDIDGNCAAMRLQSLLGKNVVVVKTRSDERQWFSSALLPWIHYIPVTLTPFEIAESELVKSHKERRQIQQRSDLKAVMEWAATNDNHTYEIMRSANIFFKNYLAPNAIKCYIKCLIHEIALMQDFNVSSVIDELSRIQHRNIHS